MTYDLATFVALALKEDIGPGDHTSIATVPADKYGSARLLVKEDGVLSGCEIAEFIFKSVDPDLTIDFLLRDGLSVTSGQIAFHVHGKLISILQAERLVLNCMQRMSGISTITRKYVDTISGCNAKILDTRKTTPLMRTLEKQAVLHGGGFNHRHGLYDMILIKDNHVDACGGITKALELAQLYNVSKGLQLKIEIETRSFSEIESALKTGIPDRIMFDNFSPSDTKIAVEMINGALETESSGGIHFNNIREYAETGVDFISVGALTHSVKSLDLSLKINS